MLVHYPFLLLCMSMHTAHHDINTTIMKLPRPIHLLLDWDGTLTRKDTLSLVGSIAYHANPDKTLPPWSDFVNGWMNDYTHHVCQNNTRSRTTMASQSSTHRKQKRLSCRIKWHIQTCQGQPCRPYRCLVHQKRGPATPRPLGLSFSLSTMQLVQ
jgi:hypothetical protein